MKRRRFGREAWLLAYFPVYLLLYFLAEHVVTQNYWATDCALDRMIPFVKEFVFFYVLWFPFMFGVTLWLLLKDGRAFWRYGWALILGTLAGFAIFFLVPNGQNLRPEAVAGSDPAALLLRLIYAVDTNTNVFPSLHVVGTLVATAGALDTDTIPRGWKWVITIAGVMINLSTVLIKQHSLLDVVSAAAIFALVWVCVYVLPRRRRADKTK